MMPAITTKMKVKRVDWIRYSSRQEKESGYCEDQGTYQVLVKTFYLFGLPIFKMNVDREDVPSHALIEAGCFGSTNWRSKFAEYMRG